jgi:hypothetical protein
LGALESVVNVLADIFAPHMTLELSLLHESGRLFARSAED